MRRLLIPFLGILVAISLIAFDLTILRSGRTAIRPTLQKGIALGLYQASKGTSYYRPALEHIAALGATHISLPVYFFQDSVSSTTLYAHPTDGASPEQHDRVVCEVIDYAHRLGLKVLLLPIVDIEHSVGKEWRGVIQPVDWGAWFRSYRAFLEHYARLAEQHDVELMSVGTELVSSEEYTDEWRATIHAVRQLYKGPLTYSANWDHYEEVQFWDALDFLGVSGYYELTDAPHPSVSQLIAGWLPIQRQVLAWQAKWGKPLLFPEIGYASQEGASNQPWNYVMDRPVNLEEQRRCYQALKAVWQNEPQFAGLYVWMWEPGRGGPSDTGYAFADKPAEAVIRGWYRGTPLNPTIIDLAIVAVERFFRPDR